MKSVEDMLMTHPNYIFQSFDIDHQEMPNKEVMVVVRHLEDSLPILYMKDINH